MSAMKFGATKIALVGLAAALYCGNALADLGCGNLENAYGPFDYRTSKNKLHIVEAYHFTPEVETLRHGHTGSLGADLDYTLRAFPNHHRALNAIVNLAVKQHTERPHGALYTIDCYFDRALRFAANDGEVRAIYGVYLSRTNRKREAAQMFEGAIKYEPRSPNLYYNLGLTYFDLKEYTKAMAAAQRAYELGAQLPGLRNKLQESGHWNEAISTEPGSASASRPAPVSD
jgi:tetratricopeptide (TPR) repeat protein